MKKLIITSIALLGLASCNLNSTPTDFQSLYDANVKAEFAETKNFFSNIFGSNQEAEWKISYGLGFAGDFEGSMNFNSDYFALSSVTSGSAVDFSNPELSIKLDKINSESASETKTGELKVSADKVSIISAISGYFLNYGNINLEKYENLPENSAQQLKDKIEQLKQFSNKWISFVPEMSEKEKMIAKNILSLDIATIEKYFTKYPFYTASGSAKVEWSKYTYEVVLNNENIANAFGEFLSGLTGEELTPKKKEEFLSVAKEINISGTITFDSKDPLYSWSELKISKANDPISNISQENITIVGGRDNNKNHNYTITVSRELDEKIILKIAINKNDFSGSVSINAGQGDLEIATLKWEIENDSIKNLDLNLNYVGIVNADISYIKDSIFRINATAMGEEIFSLENPINENGFSGKIISQKEEIANWIVEKDSDKTLKKFNLEFKNIASQFYSELGMDSSFPLLSINLDSKNPETGFVSWDIKISNLFSAKTEILYTSNQIGLKINNIKFPETFELTGFVPVYFEYLQTYNQKNSTKTIDIPTEYINISEIQL